MILLCIVILILIIILIIFDLRVTLNLSNEKFGGDDSKIQISGVDINDRDIYFCKYLKADASSDASASDPKYTITKIDNLPSGDLNLNTFNEKCTLPENTAIFDIPFFCIFIKKQRRW